MARLDPDENCCVCSAPAETSARNGPSLACLASKGCVIGEAQESQVAIDLVVSCAFKVWKPVAALVRLDMHMLKCTQAILPSVFVNVL